MLSRFRAAVLIALILVPVTVQAAAYTSTQSGNWSDPATWGASGPPADGDTAAIGTGHAVTVDVNTTVGHSPGAGDATAAILVTGTGSLTINSGVTLVCRGDLKLNNSVLTCNGTGVLEFDASQAASPSTALYVLQIGTAASQASCKLVVLGTDNANRFTIRSNAGGANARLTSGGSRGGKVDVQYCNVTRIGDASNPAWVCQDSASFADPFKWYDTTFDSCGMLNPTISNNNIALFEFVRCGFRNTVNASYSIDISSGTNLGSGGRRWIKFCGLDKSLRVLSANGFEIEDNYISGTSTTNTVTSTGGTFQSFKRNALRGVITTAMTSVRGTFEDCYIIKDHLATNPHGLTIGGSNDANCTVTGTIFEHTWTAIDGDMLLAGNTTNPRNHTVSNCLSLPNADGQAAGVFITALGGANWSNSATHNTYCSGSAAGGASDSNAIRVGETYAGHAGMYSAFKSNLAFNFVANRSLFYVSTASAPSDTVSTSDCDYNAGWNLSSRNAGLGYAYTGTNPLWSSGSGGAHDLGEVDPQFVDCSSSKWRCFPLFDTDYLGNNAPAWSSGGSYVAGDIVSNAVGGKWGGRVVNYRCISAHAGSTANSQPGSGSSWSTYWEFASAYRIREGNPLYTYSAGVRQPTVQDLATWVKAGFKPRNTALRNAGHDGATVGAFEGVWPAAGTTPRRSATSVGVSAGVGLIFLPLALGDTNDEGDDSAGILPLAGYRVDRAHRCLDGPFGAFLRHGRLQLQADRLQRAGPQRPGGHAVRR